MAGLSSAIQGDRSRLPHRNVSKKYTWNIYSSCGIGDILVARVALVVLLRYKRSDFIPPGPIFLVIALGVTDFLSAFFFGFTSSETSLQLFYPTVPNNATVFPNGMIPLSLVPHAIFFHALSALNYAMHEKRMA